MAEVRALIVAAGKGTRAGLPYPKTLYPVKGVPILLRLLELFEAIDETPTVVASPEGKVPISKCIADAGRTAHLVVQAQPRGMGDAVLQFTRSPAFPDTTDVALIWGDVPFIQPETLNATMARHLENDNDFTFPTRHVDKAYTFVSRDVLGGVVSVEETRERTQRPQLAGERDIGLFVFKKASVLEALEKDLPGKFGQVTGEHGFLYVIAHLASEGYRVEGLDIAKELDLVSLNKLSDVASFSD